MYNISILPYDKILQLLVLDLKTDIKIKKQTSNLTEIYTVSTMTLSHYTVTGLGNRTFQYALAYCHAARRLVEKKASLVASVGSTTLIIK